MLRVVGTPLVMEWPGQWLGCRLGGDRGMEQGHQSHQGVGDDAHGKPEARSRRDRKLIGLWVRFAGSAKVYR